MDELKNECPSCSKLVEINTELLEALKLVTPKECPIVTHHRQDCDFCLCLRVIAKAEGKEPPEPRKNSPYYVTDGNGNRLRHG